MRGLLSVNRSDPLPRRLFLGTVSNFLGQAVVVLSGLIVLPVIVHHVGATDYGIWVVIWSVTSFVFLLDIGISGGLVKYVAEYVSRGEREEAALMIGAATWIYAVIGVFVALGGLVLALLLPGLLDLEGHARRIVPPLVTLVAVAAGISIPAVAPLSVLRGLQRFDAVNLVTGGGAVLGAMFTVAALLLGTGIVGVAAGAVASTLITFGVSLLVVRRIAPDLSTHLVRRDGARARRLLSFSWSVAVVQVAGRLETRLDAVVIGAALPVRLVTPYDFARRLADGTRIVTEQFVKVLLPAATEVSSAGDRSALQSLFLTATRLSLGLALAVALPLMVLGGSILSLWVGSAFGGYGDVVAILAAGAVFDLSMYPAAAVLQSVERHKPLAWMALGTGVVNVLLSIAFVGPFGVVGVATATLVASAGASTLFVIPYAVRTLGVSLREVGREVLLRLTVPALILAVLLIGASRAIPMTSALRLAAVVVGALACYALVYAAVGAGPVEREAYRSAGALAIRSLLRPLRRAVSRSYRSS
jgi:O-antigen/teichoic acid export membrane protein